MNVNVDLVNLIKFFKDEYKMKKSTIVAILLIVGLNFSFYEWHRAIQVNEIVSRILIHIMTTIIIISWELLYHWFASKPWMVPLLGAWWNKYEINNPEPFCDCQKLLMPTLTGGSNVFKCSNGHEICFRDDDGNPKDIGTIKKLVKDKLQKGIRT